MTTIAEPKKELFAVIGKILIDIGGLSADLVVDSPDHKRLLKLRNRLDDCQRKLMREGLTERTTEVQAATTDIEKANKVLKESIDSVDKFAETIENIQKVVSILEKLLKVAATI